MADFICRADGNLTDAATWGVVDPTSLLKVGTTVQSVAVAAGWTSSAAAAWGAIEIDGLALCIYDANIAGGVTLSVRVYNVTGGAAVAGTTVTVNRDDIAAALLNEAGWMFFKFAAPVMLSGATNYRVEAQVSAGSNTVRVWRDATANNMCRMVRTTTTGAPAAGDALWIFGEWTAAATKDNRAVTMNNTEATDFGGLQITNGGTLDWGYAAATNYQLRVSGLISINTGGVMNIGTLAHPVPSGSTAFFEIDCGSMNQYFIYCPGTLRLYGSPRTTGKLITSCLLNTDEAIGQTTLGVSADTGWLTGDTVAIAMTVRATPADSEERTLAGDASATEIVVTAGLTNAHSGTAPNQAEVLLCNRNVGIRTTNTAYQSHIEVAASGVVVGSWAEFRYMGGANSNGSRGIDFASTVAGGGSGAFSYCSWRDSAFYTVALRATSDISITLTECTAWKSTPTSATAWFSNLSTAGGQFVVVGGAFIPGSAYACAIFDLTGGGDTMRPPLVMSGGTRMGCCGGYGIRTYTTYMYDPFNNITVDGAVFHAIGGTGGASPIILTAIRGARFTNCGFYRNYATGSGQGAVSIGTMSVDDVVFENCTFVGNYGAHVGRYSTALVDGLIFRSCTFNGEAGYATVAGFTNGSATFLRSIRFENCSFGAVTAHTTADFCFTTRTDGMEIWLINTTLATGFQAGFWDYAGWMNSCVHYQRVGGATNVHQSYYPWLGTISRETATFRTTVPSEELAPTSAYSKLRSSLRRVHLAVGGVAVVSCFVYVDGSYNGAAPRLILKANPAIGIDAETVLATHTLAVGSWVQLSGATPAAEEAGVAEVYVDCDGTAGAIYTDDWSV